MRDPSASGLLLSYSDLAWPARLYWDSALIFRDCNYKRWWIELLRNTCWFARREKGRGFSAGFCNKAETLTLTRELWSTSRNLEDIGIFREMWYSTLSIWSLSQLSSCRIFLLGPQVLHIVKHLWSSANLKIQSPSPSYTLNNICLFIHY